MRHKHTVLKIAGLATVLTGFLSLNQVSADDTAYHQIETPFMQIQPKTEVQGPDQGTANSDQKNTNTPTTHKQAVLSDPILITTATVGTLATALLLIKRHNSKRG